MFGAFLGPAVTVTKRIDKVADILKGLQALEKIDVLVGFPEDPTPHPGADITNPQLAFLMTNGCPLRRIPPRPFLQPAIERSADKLAKWQKKAIQDALKGDIPAVLVDAQSLGMVAKTEVQKFIKDRSNGVAPNAPATIARKGSDTPLIDTGALMNAVQDVIRQQ